MSRRPHSPTKATRDLVSLHSTMGTTQEAISQLLGISLKTLHKYYRAELDLSMVKANATIGGALFNKAKGGDVTAMIFWLKTRARWSEKSEVDLTSSDGSMTPKGAINIGELSDSAIAEILKARDAADS